ncbi:L-threonylcarbamoyladenylate synthase [Pseudomaricurvus sp. HS19]|uniref:L-threonylcarbamoyladenylate synthase n=1 Tax=Pseudomaricurvus sp. HS19 TaxID=2692626 RepID=UPI0013699C10|nr:Sua5/YciO/YrdC/YwlC family protein [Pseudomaricurvus sp. HS19]MYM63745.1 tRNA threonylcarbamoyladenosine biosynthesis protein RimN [Pseudomaricurvus sp. HS19]
MDWSRHPRIQRAADLLWSGAVIAYPTEAVWGLGCAPFDEQAVYRLLALKKRDYEKGLILVAADISQFADILEPLTDEQRQTLSASWPGPNTWLVPDPENLVPEWIKGQYQSVALRVSAHPLVAGLCRAFGGPIVSTSANPQGRQPALQQWQVHRYFKDSLDAVTPGAVGRQAKPTQIRDLVTGQIVRAS